MTRETKVGLLVGTGIILLIGIIVSDHLSVVQKQESAKLTTFAPDTQRNISHAPTGITGGMAGHNAELPVLPLQTGNHETVRDTLPPSQFQQPQVPAQQEVPSLIITQRVNAEQATQGELVAEARSASVFTGADSGILPANSSFTNTPSTDTTTTTPRVRTPEPVIYYVKPGDSLYQIAAQFYGSGEQWKKIADANPGAVGTNGSVRQGVRLVIPDKSHVVETLANQALSSGGASLNTQASSTATITVAAGDSLSSLAARHLGAETQWPALFEANRDKLKDADDVRVGMVLRLPGASSNSANVTTRTASSQTSRRTYTVQRGDTLIGIAQKVYGDRSRWRDIYNANRGKLRNENDLKVGAELALPSRG